MRTKRERRGLRPYNLTPEAQRLFDENHGLVGHIVKRALRHGAHGEVWADAFQCGLIALANAAERYDPQRGIAFSTYACRAVQHALVGRWQRARRDHRNLEPLDGYHSYTIPAPGLTPAERWHDGNDWAAVKTALAKLDARSRLIIELRLLSEPPVSMACISRMLGITKQRVQQLQVSAIGRMRLALREPT